MKRRDGSVQSANLPVRGNLSEADRDYNIYRCMVTEVFFIDDSRNTTFDNKQVTYEAVILGGRQEGQIITNIKNTNLFGGQYNYHERIFRKSIKPLNGPSKKGLPEQKGDIVYVTFIKGDTNLPIIIGCGTQPLDKTTTGATKIDGPIFRQEYNGIYELINKDGEYEMQRKGGSYDSQELAFVPSTDTPEVKYELLQNQIVRYTLKGGLIVELDGVNDKITVTTSGGANLIIDGSADRIQVQGSIIELGNAISDLAVLGNEMRSAFNEHTHMYFDQDTGTGAAGSATRESDPPSAPMTVDVLSTVVNLE